MSQRITLESNFAASESGLKNVSLITTGIEAEGHGVFLDEKTAETAMKKLLGRSVKSYLRHEGAGGDRLGSEIGFFSGIYRQGQQIKASAFEFLDSFKKESGVIAEKIVEMAQKVPDQFGVSLVLEYVPVWVMADGTELQASSPAAPAGAVRPIPSMRVLDVISADFVGRPAANPNGLLSADAPKVDAKAALQPSTPISSMSESAAATTVATLSVTDHEAKIAELGKSHQAALDAALANLRAEFAKEKDALTAAFAAKDEAHKAELAKAIDEAVKPVAAKLAEAEKFDARKLGVPPIAVRNLVALEEAKAAALPEPAKTDYEKWQQYSALLEESAEKAAKFKAAYLTRR